MQFTRRKFIANSIISGIGIFIMSSPFGSIVHAAKEGIDKIKAKIYKRVPAPPIHTSNYGFSTPLAPHASEVLEDLVSVKVNELFPDIEKPIIDDQTNLETTKAVMRKTVEKALDGVDLSMIKPGDPVNLLCSDHGFVMVGGWAYAEMIKAVKEIVEERTGNKNISLVYACAFAPFEALDILPRYGLDKFFGEKVRVATEWDEGIPIETCIGKLYGLKTVYDAKWIIHCHYDAPRELHYHRLNGHSFKTFGMTYARFETRSIYHSNFDSRNSVFVARAVYDSPFVQSKFVFGAILTSSPAGITGVIAGRDLPAVDHKVIKEGLSNYAKMYHLFRNIDNHIAIVDTFRWISYVQTAGLSLCNISEGIIDHLDLQTHYPGGANHKLKAVVINNMWPAAEFQLHEFPVILASKAIEDSFSKIIVPDMSNMTVETNLKSAMKTAYRIAKTDKIIVFDNCSGSINVSQSMAKHMIELAPKISKNVDEVWMPKYLKQRGISASA